MSAGNAPTAEHEAIPFHLLGLRVDLGEAVDELGEAYDVLNAWRDRAGYPRPRANVEGGTAAPSPPPQPPRNEAPF